MQNPVVNPIAFVIAASTPPIRSQSENTAPAKPNSEQIMKDLLQDAQRQQQAEQIKAERNRARTERETARPFSFD